MLTVHQGGTKFLLGEDDEALLSKLNKMTTKNIFSTVRETFSLLVSINFSFDQSDFVTNLLFKSICCISGDALIKVNKNN